MADGNCDLPGVEKIGNYYRQIGSETMIDVTANPGFGIPGLSGEAAVLRNLRIAQFMTTAQTQVKKNGWCYWPDDYAGFADHAATSPIMYMHTPRTPAIRPLRGGMPKWQNGDLPFVQVEFAAVLNVYDVDVVPGSFLARPFEGGVQWSFDIRNTSIKTGETLIGWEIDFMLIDDHGLITDWTFATDGRLSKAYEEVFGVPFNEVRYEDLYDHVRDSLDRNGGLPAWLKRPAHLP